MQLDGKVVMIKQIPVRHREGKIHKFLRAPQRVNDPRNRCVPLLDYFHVEQDPNWDFIVMPLLCNFNDVPFKTVSEVLSFMKQMLEVPNCIPGSNLSVLTLSFFSFVRA